MISAVSSLATGSLGATASTGLDFAQSPASSAVAGADFTAMLSDMTSNAISTMKTAETTSIQGLQGQASVQKVVDAVMQAETTLQTAMAIRDKVVSSYQELSRMSI
jgi:flagellar hook-basal body complex protein FliE